MDDNILVAITASREKDEIVYRVECASNISNEEFGCAIKEAYGESYKSGNKVLFSKLYDGNGGKVALSQRGGKKGVRP